MSIPYGFWISPSGEMLPVSPGKHMEMASELSGAGRRTPVERLMQRGYVRAVFDRQTRTLLLGPHFPPHGPLPPLIRRAVKDYAIENNINAAFTSTDREGKLRQRELHTTTAPSATSEASAP